MADSTRPYFTKAFWIDTVERVVRTFIQAFLASVGVTALVEANLSNVADEVFVWHHLIEHLRMGAAGAVLCLVFCLLASLKSTALDPDASAEGYGLIAEKDGGPRTPSLTY